MRQFFFLLDWLAVPLYLLVGVIVLYQLYQYLRAHDEIRASLFMLERDLARRRQISSMTMIIVSLEIALLLVGVQVRAVPYLEEERSLNEQADQQVVSLEDGVFVTDTPQAPSQEGLDIEVPQNFGSNSEAGFVPTPTLTPTPVGTILPNPPGIQGCVDDHAYLEIPANGMRVFDPIVVRGTAYTDEFSSAKLEIEGPSTNGQYVVVESIIEPVLVLSEFSQFKPSTYEPGLYQFRLTVFDITNTLVASCMVNIYISDPPVTMTPTPQAGG